MKKTKLIIIIIISVIVSVGLFICGYFMLKQHHQNAQYEEIFDIVSDYIESDAEFIDQYGEISSVKHPEDDWFDAVNNKCCVITCIVYTDSQASYLVEIEYDFGGETDKYTYLSIEKQ